MRLFSKLTLLLFSIGFLSACGSFYDDLSKCKITRMKFIYNADGSENVLKQYIHSGTLFIYDERGALFQTKYLTSKDLDNGIELKSIHSGKWHLIVWGNVSTHSRIDSQEKLATALLTTLPENNGSYLTTDSLYRADYLLDMDDLDNDKMVIVPFHSAHISFDVIVKNFDVTKSAKQAFPKISIDKAGTQYHFSGYTVPIPQPISLFSFHPLLVHSSSEDLYQARFDLFRIEDLSSIILTLEEKNGEASLIHKKISLLEYAKEQSILIKERNEVNIPILIILDKNQAGDLVVVVKPFKWGSVEIRPDGYKVE